MKNINIIDNPHFSGAFKIIDKKNNVKSVYIKKVFYSHLTTIVFWSDNTKTKSKCVGSDIDTYNKYTGLIMCIMKKVCNGCDFNNLYLDWTPNDFEYESSNTVISISDVRKKHKKLTYSL